MSRLNNLYSDLLDYHSTFLGFPAATSFDYSVIHPFLNILINNIGDPFSSSPFHSIHTHEMEREVINFFAGLFHAPSDNYWGYVSNGSTENNLYALYQAREKYPNAIVYYSDAAHYSIPKNIHILGMESCVIKSQSNGEINYFDFSAKIVKNNNRPAIIVATIGTTITEASDSILALRIALKEHGVADYFIHVDAALSGVYRSALMSQQRFVYKSFDFSSGIDSIGISGHKFIGSPIPCGVVLIRKEHLHQRERLYTGTHDSTISGSRNGHTPLFLWYAITTLGKKGLHDRARSCHDVASYALRALEDLKWPVWRNHDALTVMIGSPSVEIIQRWQLATHEGWSHIICMPGVTKEKIDLFIKDLSSEIN